MAPSAPDLPHPLLMQRDLQLPFERPAWPWGARLREFETEHAEAVHALLADADRDGGGLVEAFASWWSSLGGDPEFDPKLIFVAVDSDFRAIGVAVCWTTAYVKDLAVRHDWRGRGLGKALLLHAFDAFKQRGAPSVRLKVHADNSRAIRLYRSVGMSQMSR